MVTTRWYALPGARAHQGAIDGGRYRGLSARTLGLRRRAPANPRAIVEEKQMSGRLMRFALLLAAFFCATVHAQATQAEAQSWKWEVSAYMLGAGMDGKTGVRPNVAEVDESFGDILDNLQFGFMGRARATHGVWSFGT